MRGSILLRTLKTNFNNNNNNNKGVNPNCRQLGSENKHKKFQRFKHEVYLSSIQCGLRDHKEDLGQKRQQEQHHQGQARTRLGKPLDKVKPQARRADTREAGKRERKSEMIMHHCDYDNGLEGSSCSMRLEENIGDSSRTDIFTPQAGHISTIENSNLPILWHLHLSAERGVHHNRHLRLEGLGENSSGRTPQTDLRWQNQTRPDSDHAMVKKASSKGFKWVSFKTSDDVWISPLARRTSIVRALLEALLINAYQTTRHQAHSLKYNREMRLFC